MLKITRLTHNFIKTPILFRNITSTTRVSCSVTNQQMDSGNSFVPIYKFPYIRAIAVVNRMKLYQTGMATFSIPASIAAYYFNLLEAETVEAIALVGVFGLPPLMLASYLLQKFVGFIYYNESEDKVKVAFVDSWGKRQHVEIPRNDLVPINEMPVKFTDGFYVSLSRYSSDERLKLNLKHGVVLNDTLFKKVLS